MAFWLSPKGSTLDPIISLRALALRLIMGSRVDTLGDNQNTMIALCDNSYYDFLLHSIITGIHFFQKEAKEKLTNELLPNFNCYIQRRRAQFGNSGYLIGDKVCHTYK